MTCTFRPTTTFTISALLTIAAMTPVGAIPLSPNGARPGASPPNPTPSPELLFEPIAPCRVFDTSKTSPLVANSGRPFYVSGTSYIAAQGGKSGGCGIPASAAGVAITLTTSSSGGTGTLSGAPFGTTPQKTTTAVAYNSNASAAAGVSLGINSNRLSLRANGASTNVTGDVTGYYAPQIQAFVYANGTLVTGTNRVISAAQTGTGTYTVTVDRDVYYCAVSVTVGDLIGAFGSGGGNTNNVVDIVTYSFANGAPTRTNHDFNVSVHC